MNLWYQAAERTTRQMEKLYYWPGMRTEIKEYTSSCEACQRQQESNHSKYGLLHPLPIPDDRAVDLLMDWFFPGASIDGTDRDSKFTSEFWLSFSRQIGVQTNFATPRHQQTNGPAEIQVRIVKKVLRKYADYDATNWSTLLHLVEFSLNNAVNTSTGYSPF